MKPSAAVATTGNLVMTGVFLMLLGDMLFAFNDAMAKWMVASFAVGQVLVIRSLGSFIILGPMLIRQGPRALFQIEQRGLQLTRAVLATLDVGLFYAAVVYLPLADVMTFYMAAPLYVAALSHFMLGERIGWRRWLAIAIGFAGVVIALRPSTAMLSLHSVFGLAGSLSFALTLVMSRYLRSTSDATLVTWQTVATLIAGIALSIGHWQSATLSDWSGMPLLGVVASCGHLLITRSLKLAPASMLAPLQYTLLLWALLLGYLFFNDIPELQVIVGAAVIVLAGLFVFHRQKIKNEIPSESVPLDGH
jgi:S-adenosylmethionine uptake transporter